MIFTKSEKDDLIRKSIDKMAHAHWELKDKMLSGLLARTIAGDKIILIQKQVDSTTIEYEYKFKEDDQFERMKWRESHGSYTFYYLDEKTCREFDSQSKGIDWDDPRFKEEDRLKVGWYYNIDLMMNTMKSGPFPTWCAAVDDAMKNEEKEIDGTA